MTHEELLGCFREENSMNNALKEVVSYVEEDKIGAIKRLHLDPVTERKLILWQKDRTYLDIVIINSIIGV